ncbi:MAG: hypothetical protein ACFBSG_08275 [Leptolyngbyaceae cyanobacterium]
MTSLKRRWLVKTQRMLRACQQPFDAVAQASGRIFSPGDDDYPATGAQPFEGDIPNTHHHHNNPPW